MSLVEEKINNLKNGKIAAVTAYDYPSARLLDEAGCDLILVGDSLSMVVLGFPDTTFAKMSHILHHLRACRRAVKNAILAADLPFGSYQTAQQALKNAKRLQKAGADAVKLEGGLEVLPQVQAIVNSGIPYLGHVGMLPQKIRLEGRYKKKGKTHQGIRCLLDDALALEKCGAFSVILESMTKKAARKISENLKIPTIGIGVGEKTCDGQICVLHDLIGLYPWFTPPFAKTFTNCSQQINLAVKDYIKYVKSSC